MTDVIEVPSSSSDENELPAEDDLVITGYTTSAPTTSDQNLTINRRRSGRMRRNGVSTVDTADVGSTRSSRRLGQQRIMILSTTTSTMRRRSRRTTTSGRRRRSRRNIFDNIMINFFNNHGFGDDESIDYEQALDIASRLGSAKSTGLTQLEIASLPKRPHFGIDADCTICLEPIKKDNPTVVLDACGHLFHEGCVVEWLKIKAECPSCRGKVKSTMMIL